jgi:hypothetical protein
VIFRLLKHGVPWDIIWSLTPTRRLAYLVVAGELDGGVFDWGRMRWEKQQP